MWLMQDMWYPTYVYMKVDINDIMTMLILTIVTLLQHRRVRSFISICNFHFRFKVERSTLSVENSANSRTSA